MNNYLLTICIPTYNRIHELKRQIKYLESEKVFDNTRIQVIVSDNCSPDKTYEYLGQLKETYQNIFVNENKKNIGLIGNLYQIQRFAEGEYIWFIGDDDELAPGLIRNVMYVLNNYKKLGHIFINYSTYREKNVINDRCYHGEEGYFESGLEMFISIVNNSQSYGLQMFLTANIYRRSRVKEMNIILEKAGESQNLAIPLGYSLFCSNQSGYIIGKTSIKDEIGAISWKSKAVLVRCRDMIAISDIIALNMNIQPMIRKLLLQIYRRECPEYEYALRCKKFINDNYALKLYREFAPKQLIIDFFRYPFILMKRISKRIINMNRRS